MSKKKKKQQHQQQQQNHFLLRTISPLTINQSMTFRAFEQGKHLLLHGVAGTGKTFISLYLALNEVLNKSSYKQIIIIRSALPVKEIGFLPGGIKDKAKAYEEPYKLICDDLFDRGDGYDILKLKKIVDFTITSFLRGITLKDSIVIVDECQNMTDMEIHTILSRIGDNSRVILCGDYRQKDYMKEQSGIFNLLKIAKIMNSFSVVEFTKDDVVRSGFVKEYLFARMDLDERGSLT